MTKVRQFEPRAQVAAPLKTPTDLSPDAVNAISTALNAILADTFALYLKTKNFHWHVSGPHFRDYHLLLDEQAEQLFEVDRRTRRTRPQDRRDDAALHRPYQQAAAAVRQ